MLTMRIYIVYHRMGYSCMIKALRLTLIKPCANFIVVGLILTLDWLVVNKYRLLTVMIVAVHTIDWESFVVK